MKIEVRNPLESSSAGRNLVDDGGGHEAMPPKLQARTEGAARLMPAAECAAKATAGPAVQAQSMHWASYDALCDVDKADFPGDIAAATFSHSSLTADKTPAAAIFDERHSGACVLQQRKRNLARHFADTWSSRLPDHQQWQLEQGCYVLMDKDGGRRRCLSYSEFVGFVGAGQTGDLPERILHVAGPQLHNFLCQTYLYDPALSLFGHIGGRRIEPMPNLRSEYRIEHKENGQVLVRYLARDNQLDRAMLIGAQEYDEHEARSLAPASICFSGALVFSGDGTCTIGPVQVHATAMRFAESPAQSLTDSFA